MNFILRSAFFFLMLCAMSFGFLHLFIEEGNSHNFERLHIFLFNLCSGGTIILYYSDKERRFTGTINLFLALALFYTMFAFFEIYIPAVIISFTMALLVERIRWKRFSPFPKNFFTPGSKISEKFHHSSLLCLSLGLVISSLVILNNEFFKILSYKKLILNTFFLGFSFPVSLITMSVMFSFMEADNKKEAVLINNISFWIVNLGVVIFFFFILMEKIFPQLIITSLLFAAVIIIFIIFKKRALETQQKVFLTSGMVFLVFSALSGISYIIIGYFTSDGEIHYPDEFSKLLLKIHAIASLYGWNLSGLAVISRRENFPIKLNLYGIILLHWVIVIVLAPFGYYNKYIAVLTLVSYAAFLYNLFFSRGNIEV